MNATLRCDTGDRLQISGTPDVIAKAAIAYADRLGTVVVIEPMHSIEHERMLEKSRQFFGAEAAGELCNNVACVFELDETAEHEAVIASAISYRMSANRVGVPRLVCRDVAEVAREMARSWRGQ